MKLTAVDYKTLIGEIDRLTQVRSKLIELDDESKALPIQADHILKINLVTHKLRSLKTLKQFPKYWCNYLLAYENDPVAFIEQELKIFNPNLSPSSRSFHLYPYQRNFIKDDLYPAYLKGESILNEKTRQQGASWLLSAFSLWGLLFDPNFTGFFLSKKESLVDDGGSSSSMDSLFGKIRYMYDELTEKFKKNYRKLKSIKHKSDLLSLKHLRIANPKTGSYLVGSSANIDAGRGGTYRFVLWDETASTPKSEIIFQAIKQAGKCICYNSTVRGRGNVFARLRWDDEARIKVVTMHWSQHPLRVENIRHDEDGKLVSDWYLNECRGMTKTQIGQELDIDYESSVEGRIYSALDRKVHLTKIEWNEELRDKSIVAWDLGVSDEMFAIVLQADGQGNYAAVDEICGEDQEIRFYIDLICGVEPSEFKFMSPSNKRPYMDFLLRARARKYKYLMNVAGPDVVQRSVTSKRHVMMQFNQAGQLAYNKDSGGITNRRYVNLKMYPLTGFRIMERIIEIKRLINPMHNHVVISESCPKLWERLVNYKWSKDPDSKNKEIPHHDWASHGSDAFGYGILYYQRKLYLSTTPGGYSKAARGGPMNRVIKK